jgi:hypothetical protein
MSKCGLFTNVQLSQLYFVLFRGQVDLQVLFFDIKIQHNLSIWLHIFSEAIGIPVFASNFQEFSANAISADDLDWDVRQYTVTLCQQTALKMLWQRYIRVARIPEDLGGWIDPCMTYGMGQQFRKHRTLQTS